MATMVRLTQEQIERVLTDMQEMEDRLKDMHAELIEIGTPRIPSAASPSCMTATPPMWPS